MGYSVGGDWGFGKGEFNYPGGGGGGKAKSGIFQTGKIWSRSLWDVRWIPQEMEGLSSVFSSGQ